MSAKILIVDDHEIVRQGIHTILHRARPDWEICGESTNGREAIVRATGAHGYVMKSHATRDLIFAIDRAGGTFFEPPVNSKAEKGDEPSSGLLLCRALSFA